MGHIFLGKTLHWALIAAIIVISWLIGLQRLHVSSFNLFTVILLGVSVAAVAIVLLTTRPGEQVTRDPLDEE